jgi:NAD-specific glutamate dehydrogenase
MNNTVRDVLKSALYEAKKQTQEAKAALERSIIRVHNLKGQLKSAEASEAFDRGRFEVASKRLNDLTNYLMDNGEGTITIL